MALPLGHPCGITRCLEMVIRVHSHGRPGAFDRKKEMEGWSVCPTPDANTYTHTLAHTHAHMHAHTHTHARTHACTHMHTHTHMSRHRPSTRKIPAATLCTPHRLPVSGCGAIWLCTPQLVFSSPDPAAPHKSWPTQLSSQLRRVHSVGMNISAAPRPHK